MSDFPFATPFMTAVAGQCRYFLGEEIGMHATVCGCKTLAGLSYCAPHARIAASAERELAMFREKVAQEYATIHLIDRLEERLVRSLDRIGERFDKFLTVQSGKPL